MENDTIDDSSANEDTDTDKPNNMDYGQIQVFVQYLAFDLKLVIKIIKAKDLINYVDSDKSAYVSMIIVSDTCKKRTKRKTKVVKPSAGPEPVWEETFEFLNVPVEDLMTKTIEMTVKNDHTIFKRKSDSFMGRCLIELVSLDNIGEGNTSWYKLESKQSNKEETK